MVLKVAFSLLIFSLLEDISIGGNECLPNLKNIAVYEGDQNTIVNLKADPNNVKWTIIPTSDEFDSYNIWNGSQVDPSLTNLYNVNQSGLVIRNATMTPTGDGPISTSGLYIAQCPEDGNRTGAKLLVVRKAPECSCNASSSNDVQLSCTIIYTDGTTHPIDANIIWKIGDDFYTTDTPPRTRSDYYAFQSTSTITVDTSVHANFTCAVTFSAPTQIQFPYIAANAPEFSASCSVTATATNIPDPTTTAQPPTTVPSTINSMYGLTTTDITTTTNVPETTTTTQPPTTESSTTASITTARQEIEYTCQLGDLGKRVHELCSHTRYDCVNSTCGNTCKGGQCVAYIKCRCTKNGRYPPNTGAWRPGQRLQTGDGKCNRNIANNTAIATFNSSDRFSRHAAVFIKCVDDNTVQVYHQYCGRSVGYSNYGSSHHFYKDFATIRSSSDGPDSICCRSEIPGPTNCKASVPGCK